MRFPSGEINEQGDSNDRSEFKDLLISLRRTEDDLILEAARSRWDSSLARPFLALDVFVSTLGHGALLPDFRNRFDDLPLQEQLEIWNRVAVGMYLE